MGQGYVGLPLAMAAAAAGFKVVGLDNNLSRIQLLSSGRSPIEDISDQEIDAAVRSGRYRPAATVDEAVGFEIAVVTVPTPLKQGQPDLSFIQSAIEDLAPYLSHGSLVILESTTYPGTTDELVVPLLEKGSGLVAGQDFLVGYSPERIDPGNKVWNLQNTPKVVSGIDSCSLERVTAFYQSMSIPVVPVSGTREAEMTKLLENTFRHVNIALVNELAMFSDHLGVDIWEAIGAASTKPFGFMSFSPGPGVGGHCLPVDPSYLSWAIRKKAKADFRFVSLANEINDAMAVFVVDKAVGLLTAGSIEINGARCLIVGLAYKPGTGDTRESPSLAVVHQLALAGAEIFAIDDYVRSEAWPPHVQRVSAVSEEAFDLTILLTDHPGLDHKWILASAPLVLDTRNALPGNQAHRM